MRLRLRPELIQARPYRPAIVGEQLVKLRLQRIRQASPEPNHRAFLAAQFFGAVILPDDKARADIGQVFDCYTFACPDRYSYTGCGRRGRVSLPGRAAFPSRDS